MTWERTRDRVLLERIWDQGKNLGLGYLLWTDIHENSIFPIFQMRVVMTKSPDMTSQNFPMIPWHGSNGQNPQTFFSKFPHFSLTWLTFPWHMATLFFDKIFPDVPLTQPKFADWENFSRYSRLSSFSTACWNCVQNSTCVLENHSLLVTVHQICVTFCLGSIYTEQKQKTSKNHKKASNIKENVSLSLSLTVNIPLQSCNILINT